MSFENIKFTFVENEEGFTVNIKGDKEKLRAKLEAFEAYLNFREKAKKAGFEHPGSDSPIHQFFKAMHKHHAHHGHAGQGHYGPHGPHGPHGHYGNNGDHPSKHRHCGEYSKGEAPVSQTEDNSKVDE